MTRSVDYRRDLRSKEKFEKDIKETTSREKMLMDLWVNEMAHRGFNVVYKDNGVDNSGKLVEQSNNKADFKVWITRPSVDRESQYLIEVKANPWGHRQSFKVNDLQEYIKQKAIILLIYDIGHDKTKINPKTSQWALIYPYDMAKMLAENEIITNDPRWGNKPVIIIKPPQYKEYFVSYDFKHL